MSDKTYLNIDEKELIKDLQLGVVEILFEKKDGSNRLMRCTLQSSFFKKPYLSEEERINHANALALNEADPTKVRVLHVWDVDVGDWRSFRVNRVLSAQMAAG